MARPHHSRAPLILTPFPSGVHLPTHISTGAADYKGRSLLFRPFLRLLYLILLCTYHPFKKEEQTTDSVLSHGGTAPQSNIKELPQKISKRNTFASPI